MENRKSESELFLECLLLSSPFCNELLIAEPKTTVPFLTTFFHILILMNWVMPCMHLANLFIQLIVGATLELEQFSSSNHSRSLKTQSLSQLNTYSHLNCFYLVLVLTVYGIVCILFRDWGLWNVLFWQAAIMFRLSV